jgi:hypothetical protein
MILSFLWSASGPHRVCAARAGRQGIDFDADPLYGFVAFAIKLAVDAAPNREIIRYLAAQSRRQIGYVCDARVAAHNFSVNAAEESEEPSES